jgi:hypothetical protein
MQTSGDVVAPLDRHAFLGIFFKPYDDELEAALSIAVEVTFDDQVRLFPQISS